MIIRPFNAAYLLLLAFAAGAVVLLWALCAAGRSAAVPPCLSRCVQ